MQVDQDPFPINTLELKNPKVIWLNQVVTTKGKENIINGERRHEPLKKG
jgi:hypothetical protein